MNVFVHSLGCRVNQYESEVLAQRLRAIPDDRTVHLINTCAVTTLAERKGRKLVRRLRRQAETALVVAVGCQATLFADSLSQAGADLVIHNRDKSRLPQLLAAYLGDDTRQALNEGAQQWPPLEDEQLASSVDRARPVLKVQDGCSEHCSYCITRNARGPLRSKGIPAVLGEARRLAQAGYKELVLTGVNLGQYGRDRSANPDLVDLLQSLVSALPNCRFRLSSLGPESVSDRLIQFLARHPEVCPHLHLPLQSGDDRILELMRRPYTAADFQEQAARFLSTVPGSTLGTDIMVGFPGEDGPAYQRTVELLQNLQPLNTHVFRFSARPGTPAAHMGPSVPPQESKARAEQLHRLAAEWSLAVRKEFLGTRAHVLVEHLHSGTAWGHSENYMYVGFPSTRARRGTITPVRIAQVGATCTMGVNEDNYSDV